MEMPETPTLSPDDIIKIVVRRKWSMILPAIIVFTIAAITALALSPVYKTSTTILIEQQDVPEDFVKTTVSTYAEHQLQIINQRIMSSTRLLEIINRFNLYQEDRKHKMTDEIINQMREDIQLTPISGNIGKGKTGTIAFTLSYEGKNDPEKVLQIANVLASLFLEENVQVRSRQATEVSQFLGDEMNKVKTDLDTIDSKITRFKQENINALPEVAQANLQSINEIQRTIDQLTNQINQLKEREGILVNQLSNVSPDSKESDRQRLNELNILLVNLRNKFSDEYPDVVKTKAEIADLEKRISTSSKSDRPDNPAYINMSLQISTTRADIRSANIQIRDLRAKLESYRRSIAMSPQVESQYRALMTERDNTQAKYDDLMKKFMESKVSQGLETEQKGERFTIIDPARLPEKPYKPNRMAIILIGLVLGIGTGVGTVAAREYLDSSVHSVEALTAQIDFPVLATIPDMVNESEPSLGHGKLIAIVAGAVLACAAIGLAIFNYAVMNLDVFWAKLMRWLGI